jgi:predicted transcriptional regulator
MKLLWTILIGLAAAILGVVALNAAGVVDIHWQQIATGLGVIAGPFKYLFSLFRSSEDKVKAIRQQHQAARAREAEFQEKLESAIQKDKQQVDRLRDKVENLEGDVDTMQQRAKALEEEVRQMKVSEKKARARELFGEF